MHIYPNATFKVIDVFLSKKSIKCKYQHCISTSNGSISIDISIVLRARFKKALGAVGRWGLISKKIEFPFFWPKAKIYHPGKLKFQNDLKRVYPNAYYKYFS